jgi:WXG100 family type VII secretion target
VFALLKGGYEVSEHVTVNPVDLWMSSDHLAVHSADLRAAHAAADADVEATQAGWAGESSVAMQTKLSEWQGFTQRICAALDEHHVRFRAAGDAYATTDETQAAYINSQQKS